MTAPLCVRCGRPTPDGYGCMPCAVDRPRQLLAEIVDMLPAARDIAQRQARYGGGGGGSGKPGSSLPLDLGATARLDAVTGNLTTWARHVGEERGVNLSEINGDGLTWLSRSPEWVDQARAALGDLKASARWLADQCEWLRHRPEVNEWLTDVEACARVVRGLARGPAEQRYLGPCGAPAQVEITTFNDPEPVYMDGPTCEGDVYGRVGAELGYCRTCGATVSQDERRAWLDGEVRAHAFRAAHIADAYGIPANTIRTWADRGRLVAHGHDTRLRPLYNVGEVLDLAAADAARRAENEAKRERRQRAEMGA